MSGLRSWSVRMGSPPAASICIIRDVPDRGKPETTVITIRPSSCHRPMAARSRRGREFNGPVSRQADRPGLAIEVSRQSEAEQFQNSRRHVDNGGLLVADLVIAEKDSGDQSRVDAVVA